PPLPRRQRAGRRPRAAPAPLFGDVDRPLGASTVHRGRSGPGGRRRRHPRRRPRHAAQVREPRAGTPRPDLRPRLTDDHSGGARRASRRLTLSGTGIPGLRPGEAVGVPYELTIGRTPAHVSRSASGESSSSGGPPRTLTEASPISSARISVAFSSFAFGWRTSAQRPGISFSVNAPEGVSRAA